MTIYFTIGALLLISAVHSQNNNPNQYGGGSQPNQNGNMNQYGGGNQPNQNGNMNQYGGGNQPNPNMNQYGGNSNPNGNMNQYGNNQNQNSNDYGNQQQYGNQQMNSNQQMYGNQQQYGGGAMMGQCHVTGPIDLVFIIDETATMTQSSWEVQVAANMTMGMTLGPQNFQVGLVLIRSQAMVVFNLNTYTSNQALYNAIIANMPTMDMSQTPDNLASAINMAVTQIYTPAGGVRSYAPNVIVILSDGTNDNSNTAAAYQMAQQKQIAVYGIYTGATNDQQSLQKLKSACGNNVLIAANYPTFPMLLNAGCSAISMMQSGGGGNQQMNNNNNNMYGNQQQQYGQQQQPMNQYG